MKSTCLWYALDKWASEGGRLSLVKSTHWCIPHIQHTTVNEVLTQFVPLKDLKEPWYSLFGFEGTIEIGDKSSSIRGKMNPYCMFIGTCILFVFGAAWFISRAFKTENQ